MTTEILGTHLHQAPPARDTNPALVSTPLRSRLEVALATGANTFTAAAEDALLNNAEPGECVSELIAVRARSEKLGAEIAAVEAERDAALSLQQEFDGLRERRATLARKIEFMRATLRTFEEKVSVQRAAIVGFAEGFEDGSVIQAAVILAAAQLAVEVIESAIPERANELAEVEAKLAEFSKAHGLTSP